MRWLLQDVGEGSVNILQSSWQVTTLFSKVRKAYVSVRVAGLLLDQGLEYFSGLANIFMFDTASQIELGRDFERLQPQVLAVTFCLQSLAVGQCLFEHLFRFRVLLGIEEQNGVVVQQIRWNHGLSQVQVSRRLGEA